MKRFNFTSACLLLLSLQSAFAASGWYYVKDSEWLYSEKEQTWFQVIVPEDGIWVKNAVTGVVGLLGFGSGDNPSSEIPDRTESEQVSYAIVDTGQILCYDNASEIEKPNEGSSFFGQDAQYRGNQPSYLDNGDGTVSDLITGLMWTQNPGSKVTYAQAKEGAGSNTTGGYSDWRLPTIKELFSLIDFSGMDPSGPVVNASSLVPFIDTKFFHFEYGDTAAGERLIDSQFVSSTEDTGDSEFGGGELVFGVNFADGRIKGYPSSSIQNTGQTKTFFVLYVRGNPSYGNNQYQDNGDGTITDLATGLMWCQADDGRTYTWEEGLEYADSSMNSGYSDWRLPNAKELQSIVDYQRSPGSTGSAAIDPVFFCTSILNEAGQSDFPYYWTSTTHANLSGGSNACYVSFGRAMGYFNGWQDVHGAGAQRSDPKVGNAEDYPFGHGPQGDAIRIKNFVRLVRDANL